MDRLKSLDGLRGASILIIAGYHAYAAPGSGLAYAPIFHDALGWGWVAVRLFFLISGFVIFNSLDRCAGIGDFARKRWLRLFPAMAIATIILFLFAKLTGLGQTANPNSIDILPGLSFINPALIHMLTGMEIKSLDEPFWTIYVEAAFYVSMALAYYFLGRTLSVYAIFGASVIAVLMGAVFTDGFLGRVALGLDWMGFTHFIWFAAGAALCLYKGQGRARFLWSFIAMSAFGVVAAYVPGITIGQRAILTCTIALFYAGVMTPMMDGLLGNRVVQFFGFVSYPLYLVHNNLMAGLTVALYREGVSAELAPIPSFAVVCGVSALIAYRFEPGLRRALMHLMPAPARSPLATAAR